MENNNHRIPALRFPGFEGEWEEKRFGDLIRESREVSTVENEDILLTSAIDGIYLNSEVFSHQRGQSTVGYRRIKKGMLVLSAQNLHLGNANVNMRFTSGLVSPAYKVFHVIGCEPEFLAHWVKQESTKQFFLRATTQGASGCRKNVVWEQLYKQTLVIPTLEEQHRISSCLSELDDIVSLQMEKITSLKQQKKGLMQKLFPLPGETTPRLRFPEFEEEWEEKQLRDICKICDTRCGIEKTNLETYISTENMVHNLGGVRMASNMPKVGTFTRFLKGDVLFSNIRPYLKKVWQASFDGTASNDVIVFRAQDGYDSRFISQIIMSDSFIAHSMAGAKGVKMPRGDKALMLDYRICVPTLSEQKRIADYLHVLDSVIAYETAKEKVLVNYKKGLLQQLFPTPNNQ